MRRVPLYSSSGRSGLPGSPGAAPAPGESEARPAYASRAPGARQPPATLRAPRRAATLFASAARHRRALLAAAALAAAASVALRLAAPHWPARIAQEDIDAAVLQSLQTASLPSPAARAYEIIRPAVVRVRALEAPRAGHAEVERSVGTGVVIVDTGTILTNLHVVAGAPRVRVEFADGLESDASIVALEPDQDLAVLQAKSIPDDLAAATMRSTRDLAVGDHVVAVGFPFGIGPSASAGVVSGLRREFRSPEGERLLTDLIQFDAAANPGNSGGPLVTADGEVVGIVTAIMNPTDQRVFIGIGFAVPIETAARSAGMSPF